MKREEQKRRTERLLQVINGSINGISILIYLYIQENVELIAERARAKQAKDKADIAYVKEVDAKFAREDEFRKSEVARRFKNANKDGPAIAVTLLLKELEKQNREDMYEKLRQSENSLNKQLEKSENCKIERARFFFFYLIYAFIQLPKQQTF